jgi:hypothetical protein
MTDSDTEEQIWSTPMLELPASSEEIERFFRYVEVLPNGCWFWAGGRSRGKGNRKWYGSFHYRGRTIRSHVFANDVLAERGPPPPGHERDHCCKFSLCVNYKHIEVVPKAVNGERRWEGRRRKSELDCTSVSEERADS